MTTFRTRFIQCPACNEKMYIIELTSFIVLNSIVYSDGKCENNTPSSQDSEILICNACYKPMWKNDVILDEEYDENNNYPEVKDVYDLPIRFEADFSYKLSTYYDELLVVGFANTPEKEIYLRIRIWQLLNNSVRNKSKNKVVNTIRSSFSAIADSTISSKEDKPEDDFFSSNLKKLISIYKPNTDEQQLLLAEMYREIGNYKESQIQLDKVKNIRNSKAFSQISKQNYNNKSKVIKII